MAYKKNYLDEEEQQGTPNSSGTVLAGNSAGSVATPATPQAKGSGWTNLQQYLDMNAGQTGGLADTYVGANQKAVDNAKALGADLVKNTQNDQKWNQQINQAKDIANQVKTGDVSKVDQSQFKGMMSQNYGKPQSLNELGGYQDVLGAFSKAADRVDTVNDYGTQKATLRDEFSKNYNQYNSGMATLDTFLLRGDKDAAAKTAAFQQANKSYGSQKDSSGARTGVSQQFNESVANPLDKYFANQESAFNAAKGEMSKAVSDRRAAIEQSVSPEMIAARKAEIDAANSEQARQMREAALKAGVVTDTDYFARYGSSSGNLDVADLLSDSDWQALAALEGLDGGRSSIQDQARGDYSVSFDSDAANRWIQANTPPTPAPRNPEVKIGTAESSWADPTSEPWKNTEKPVEKVKESVTDQAKAKWVKGRNAVTSGARKVAAPLIAPKKWF